MKVYRIAYTDSDSDMVHFNKFFTSKADAKKALNKLKREQNGNLDFTFTDDVLLFEFSNKAELIKALNNL